MDIRTATRRDYPTLAALLLRLDHYHRDFSAPALRVDTLEELLACDAHAVLIEGRGGGFLHAWDQSLVGCPATCQGVMYVSQLYVVPALRRQGLGTALLQAAFRWGVERGLSRVRLHVWQANEAAQAFYAALGFQRIGDALECHLL